MKVIPATQSLAVPLRFVSAALLTASKDDIRHYLNGVYLHAVDDEVRVIATDGHRMIVSRFIPEGGAGAIPAWAEAGVIIPRNELAQALPVLTKNGVPAVNGYHLAHHDQSGEIVVEYADGLDRLTLRDPNGFASFKVKPVEGKFPDYARVLAASGAALARGEAVMRTASIDIRYVKGAADIGAKLGAKAVNSFLSDGDSASLFTFDGAPDTVLIIMPMRPANDQVSDGVVKMLGSEGVRGSVGALRAHVTRTVKLLGSTKNEKERHELEARKSGFEQRIAHLLAVTADGPKQLEHREAA